MTDGTPPKENAFPPPIQKFQLQAVNTLSLITLFNQEKKTGRCYGEHVGEHIGNSANRFRKQMRTHWELKREQWKHIGNQGKVKINKNPLHQPPPHPQTPLGNTLGT